MVRAVAEARRQEIEAHRAVNNELARLIAFAFHQPNKMPEYEPMGQQSVTTEADEIYAVHYLKSWAKGSA